MFRRPMRPETCSTLEIHHLLLCKHLRCSQALPEWLEPLRWSSIRRATFDIGINSAQLSLDTYCKPTMLECLHLRRSQDEFMMIAHSKSTPEIHLMGTTLNGCCEFQSVSALSTCISSAFVRSIPSSAPSFCTRSQSNPLTIWRKIIPTTRHS